MEPHATTTMPRAGEVIRGRGPGPALLARYRRAGADPPFGDPARDHGAPFEGYYWRITDADRGRVVIALCGVCVLPRRRWAVLALASHPGGRVHTVITGRAAGDPARFGVRAEGIGEGSERELRLALGPDAALEVELRDLVGWPRPALGGSGPAHLLPGLPQYWHPWAMGGLVAGEARIGGELCRSTGRACTWKRTGAERFRSAGGGARLTLSKPVTSAWRSPGARCASRGCR